jgi:hypothetical protein
MKRASFIGFGVAALGLSVWLIAGAGSGTAGDAKANPWQPILPPQEYAKLVKHDAKLIQDALAKDVDMKKEGRKLKATALMIAAYAQSTKDAKELSGVRDTALQLLDALENDKIADAKKYAEQLAAGKGGTAGKGGLLPLQTKLKLEDIMHQFTSEMSGGFGYETEFEELADAKEALKAEQIDSLVLKAYKVATVSQLAEASVPAEDDGAKTRKAWLNFAGEFRKSALGLAEAARGKKDSEVKTALQTLNMTCKKCHDVFQ